MGTGVALLFNILLYRCSPQVRPIVRIVGLLRKGFQSGQVRRDLLSESALESQCRMLAWCRTLAANSSCRQAADAAAASHGDCHTELLAELRAHPNSGLALPPIPLCRLTATPHDIANKRPQRRSRRSGPCGRAQRSGSNFGSRYVATDFPQLPPCAAGI